VGHLFYFSLYVNYNGSLSYSVNFIADSIYVNSIVLLTVWIIYSSNWNSIRLCLNMSASILYTISVRGLVQSGADFAVSEKTT